MSTGVWILMIVLLLGALGQNMLVALSAGIILTLHWLHLDKLVFPLFNRYALSAGLVLLLVGMLTPLIGTSTESTRSLQNLLTPAVLAGIIGGAIASVLGMQGVQFLNQEPSVILGLVVGSIFGVVFLHGFPIGPLTSAGLASVAVQLWILLR